MMSARQPEKLKFREIKDAAPGYFVLTALDDDSGVPSEAFKSPVMFWAIEAECLIPYPITLEGPQTDNVYILQPDGSVERPWVDGFSSVDCWLEDQQAKHARGKRGHDGR